MLAAGDQKIKHVFFGGAPLNLTDGKPHIFDLDIQSDTKISIKHFPNQHLAEEKIKQGLTWND